MASGSSGAVEVGGTVHQGMWQLSTGSMKLSGCRKPNADPYDTIGPMSQKFTPEEHQQFLAAVRILDDTTRSPQERLDACRTVIMMCTSPIPSSPYRDPDPYCPGWLDAFGRAHDLKDELLRQLGDASSPSTTSTSASSIRRAAAKIPRDRFEIVRDGAHSPETGPLAGRWVQDARLPGRQGMRRIPRS